MSLKNRLLQLQNTPYSLTQNEQVLPKFLCNIFASQAVAIKRSNESWVRISTQLTNYSKNLEKNISKKIYIYISTLSFRFIFSPFKDLMDWGFDPLKETHHSVDFQETQEEQNWREISSSSPPRIFPPSVVWWAIGWCARALKACESQR